MIPVVFGFSGPALLEDEKAFFASTQPFGFILFQRNITQPAQVRALTRALRDVTGRADVPVFIDQEGGRVTRLKPPHWAPLPSMRVIGRVYEEDAARGLEAMQIHARMTARRLGDLGINVNCAPVLDLYLASASEAIGDRAFSGNAEVVAALGRAAVDTYLANGVVPVIKHLPGHGRVMADPHENLPFVDCPRSLLEARDFRPFKALKDAPAGMNCHVLFRALDAERPVSLSPEVHRAIIRGVLDFQGLLFSDDITMKALNGPLPEVAGQVLEAGADIVLHCSGNLDDMRAIAAGLPAISAGAMSRWKRAQAMVRPPAGDFNESEAWARFDVLVQAQGKKV